MNSNTTALTAFEFTPGLSIQATTTKDGQVWFIAQDISKALGFRDANKATRLLDDDELGTQIVGTNAGNRTMTTVSESGMYSLIMRSNKAEAKAFKKWVTATVLPTLRKDGIYIAGQEKPIPLDMTADELLAQMADIQAKLDNLNAARMRQFSENHREEKEGRASAFKAMRGLSPFKLSSK
jgi:prophage antirepressor-like protein